MPEPAESAAGSIYDLGYRHYEGTRLGRRHAVLSLYIQSLRGVFGFGRHTSSKIIPIGLTIVALLPALIQLGFISIAKDNIAASDIFQPSDYYEFIQWPLALFVAAVGPELVGRDQRNRTLSLYFSRALLRSDYVLAKVASLATALIIISLVPQLLVFAGNSLAGANSLDYLRDHWRDIAPIIGSGILLSLLLSSIAIAIASQTSRWQLASGGVVGYFAITYALGSILVASFPNGPAGYSLLFSGFHVARGVTLWLFGLTPMLSLNGDSGLGDDLARADLPTFAYAIAAGVTIAITLAITYRRYRRLDV
jgi:ABC-2 type transport system permease protein